MAAGDPEAGAVMEAARRLAREAGLGEPLGLTPLEGGRNNRVYRVKTPAGLAVLKRFFVHPADPRDRLGAEERFLRFAAEAGLDGPPRLLAASREAGALLLEHLPGRRLGPGEVTPDHARQAASFLESLCRASRRPGVLVGAPASEACFSMAEHLETVSTRVARLGGLAPVDALDESALALARGPLARALARAAERAAEACRRLGLDPAAPLPGKFRIVSPSDFGLHNALADAGERLRFIDFEYAGWDDPAKAVCDFFCQPETPAPGDMLPEMARTAGRALGDPDFEARVGALYPLYRVKWCCIVMNDFLSLGAQRRAHALGRADRRREQLRKAVALLETDFDA